jgi:2-polyprenyl-3-methyl-5-hydroxy-6-metoxy-1,4-benzoquinol methylase
MLESAATDPYAQCGLTKVVCISHLDEFCLHHLPDVYLGRIGIEKPEIDRQIARLLRIRETDGERGPLVEPATGLDSIIFDKKYFGPRRRDILELMPPGPMRLLSVGCDRGLTEGELVKRGYAVTAVPLDCVIAESARMRGIRTTAPDLARARDELAGEAFDGLLFNGILAHVPEPARLLRDFTPLLKKGGFVVVGFENAEFVTALRRTARSRKLGPVSAGEHFARYGFHRTGIGTVRRWLKDAGLRPEWHAHVVPDRFARHARLFGGLADRWLGQTGAVRAVSLRQGRDGAESTASAHSRV